MSGRLLLVVLLAVAVVAGLWLSGVLSLDESRDTARTEDDGDPDLLEGQDAPLDADADASASLATIYGEGDMGAVKCRLLRVTPANEPVVDQPVVLLGRTGSQVASATSDAQGRVLFSGVRPGPRYSLRIEGEDFATVRIRNVSVQRQQTQDLGDILLGERVVLRGRVVSGTGMPLPGSTVSVYETRPDAMREGFVFRIATETTRVPLPLERVTTDEAGIFTFATLQDGTYRLVARQGGYASKHQSDVLVNENRSAHELTVVLGPGATMQGVVKDGEGKPVADAQVIALRDFGMRRFSIEREITTTDAQGRYALDTLQLGASYRLGVMAEGYATAYDQNPTEVDNVVMTRDFTIERGGAIRGVVVSKADGTPVAGAQVAAIVGRMGRRRGGNNTNTQGTAQSVETDEQGRFAFTALVPGPVMSLAVKAPGYVSHAHSMFTGNQLPEVTSGGDQDVRVELDRGGLIQGAVKDDQGTPLIGAMVSLRATGMSAIRWMGAPQAFTAEDGTYELAGIPTGAYHVTARVDGYAEGETEEPVQVPEGGTVRARDVRLTQAGQAMGVVRTPDGEPLAGALVRGQAQAEEGRGGRWGTMRRRWQNRTRTPTMTDDKGKFLLKGLGAKVTWTLRVEHDDFVTTDSKPFRVKAGETHETEITMQRGASVSGVVVAPSGERAAGVRVQVGTLGPEEARRMHLSSWEADQYLEPEILVTDAEGKFRAENLAAGVLLVKAEKTGYVDYYRRNVRLSPGQAFDGFRIELSEGETVTGTVLGADGQPLEGARLALDPRADPQFFSAEPELAPEGETGGDTVTPRLAATTGGDGTFTIERVPPGTYSALIWFAPGHRAYRQGSEAAIQRDVVVPGTTVTLRLEASTDDRPGGQRR